MNLQISGGVDSLTLIDEHGNTVCTFAKCDEEARQLAQSIVDAFNTRDEECRWDYDEDMDFYESACGETWTFIDGTVETNSATFCHGCGKRIKSVYPRPEDA